MYAESIDRSGILKYSLQKCVEGYIWIIFMPLNCSIFDIVCEITGNGTLKTLKISLQTSNMFLAFSGENHFCILNSQISNDLIFQYVDIHRNIECRYI